MVGRALRFCSLHLGRPSASWRIGCNSRRPFAAISSRHWRRWLYWPCTDRGRFFGAPARLLLGIFGIDSARENRICGDRRASRRAFSARALAWRQIALRFAEIIPLHSIETVGGFRLFVFGAAFGHRQRPRRSSLHSKNGNDCRSNKQGVNAWQFPWRFPLSRKRSKSFANVFAKLFGRCAAQKRAAIRRAVLPAHSATRSD